MAGRDGDSGTARPAGVDKRRRSGGGRSGRSRDRRRRHSGRRDRPKTQEQLDFEMDLFAAERDGRDVEEVKAAYRKKREDKRKNDLDSQMDSYFAENEEAEDGDKKNSDRNGANGDPGKVEQGAGTDQEPSGAVTAGAES